MEFLWTFFCVLEGVFLARCLLLHLLARKKDLPFTKGFNVFHSQNGFIHSANSVQTQTPVILQLPVRYCRAPRTKRFNVIHPQKLIPSAHRKHSITPCSSQWIPVSTALMKHVKRFEQLLGKEFLFVQIQLSMWWQRQRRGRIKQEVKLNSSGRRHFVYSDTNGV